ncbi:MAG: DUF4838 domain-containing protein [Armatimonadetes bacterium]|nr:DUF4838 domain-containing protein [Armatimonadota bacterium]
MKPLAVLMLILLVATQVAAADICLVRDGQPLAQIVIPDGASDQVGNAAARLAAYVKTASGAELPVVKEPDLTADARQPLVLVGQTKLWPAKFPKGLDDDGFVIAAKGRAVSICGPTDWGTEFGVYDLLERYVGVRWLLPGENGTDVPTAKTISIPEGRVQDQPVFFSRLFSGLRGAPQAEWARCNRMHGRVSFHHSLGENIFKPELYTQTHPEFFPMKDGQTRYLPPDKHYHGWQPCFSDPGTVPVAIDAICAYFAAHPEAPSFSLGVNDSSGHCHCPKCQARLPEQKNFLGMYDYSDIYYDWCNQVIAGVLKQYPDKWFGCLAYSEVAAPPQQVKVHERLIPYMTYDRMKWIDPEVEADGHAATEAWHAVSPTLGWYDYIYGTPYCLPRVWFHHNGVYERYAEKQGVKAHYAEIYPNWGEGPKPYLFMKLWWNPNQDVDKLLNEWYERCVGKKAAPDLKAYYAIWERFWTKDILNSKWFSKGGQYLNFGSPGYLADVKKADILESRRLLDSCLAKCATDQQRARAELLEKAFQYYEASALAYLATSAVPGVIETEAQALAALQDAGQGMEMAHKRRVLALEVYPKDPVLVNPLGIDRFGQLAGETWGGSGLWAVMDFLMSGNQAVRARVEELAKSPSALVAQQAQFMLGVADGKTQIVSKNPSFDEAGVAPWGMWVKPEGGEVGPPVGKLVRSEEQARTGKYSLMYDHMYRGGPTQIIDFPGPGRYLALAWVFMPEGQEVPRGTFELAITPRDEKGANLPGYSTKITPTPGKWKLVVTGAQIPAEINGKPVKSLFLIPIIDSFQPGVLHVDDVSLHKLE